MTPEEHGRRLKAAMILKGVTDQVIADALNVNRRTVRNWTAGRTLPSLEKYLDLQQLLGDYDT